MSETPDSDEAWMRLALAQAQSGAELGEVPVGALVVRDGELLGAAFNQPIRRCDPSAHAEILALRQAAEREHNYRLPGTTLYVTLEPCTMCIGALIHARVARLVYGTTEPKAGVVESRNQLARTDYYNHSLDWRGGVLAEDCQVQLQAFFRERRAQAKAGEGAQKPL